jgi:antitoxin YefM
MLIMPNVQYISDTDGTPLGVFVPIELWQEIESEKETAYLLESEKMKERLLEAKNRDGGLSLEDVREKFGI